MSLPTIKNATFTIKLKEFQKPLKIRPMIVAEHKSIQQAIDIASDEDVAITIANITKSCTDGIITADSVPQYIMDYVFLQIYIASVESKVNSKYTCKKTVVDDSGKVMTDPETGDEMICDGAINVQIPLDRAQISYPKDFEEIRKINLSESVTLFLKGLTLTDNIDIKESRDSIIELVNEIYDLSTKEYEENDPEKEKNELKIKELEDKILIQKRDIQDNYLYKSIDYIQDGEEVSKPEENFNKDEFIEWIKTCPSMPLSNIDKFYLNSPEISMELDIQCPTCGNKENVRLRGLKDFFS